MIAFLVRYFCLYNSYIKMANSSFRLIKVGFSLNLIVDGFHGGALLSRTGIIFDFDGTIALSEHVHMQAWQDLAVHYGQSLPGGFLERGVGLTDAELAAELAEHWAEALVTGVGELLVKKRKNYQERCFEDSLLVPGIAAALEKLAARFPLAIATSASRHDIAPTMRRYDLVRHFQAIVTIEDVEKPKPDPEIYLLAAKKIGVDPQSSFAFEDSPAGARAARAAGLKVIGMTTTFPSGGIGDVVASIADYTAFDALFKIITPC